MHVLTAPHVQIVASKSRLSKDCYTFNQLLMLSLFTFSDLSFVFVRRNKTDSHDYERSDKREILSRQTCTNDSVILFTASSSRALNSNHRSPKLTLRGAHIITC